ncbi:MAG: hypothetical protein IT257_01745 [Chitinophagaceae bacterium]|nr:hypothetical protein [Chitinophagaceae bacterium]
MIKWMLQVVLVIGLVFCLFIGLIHYLFSIKKFPVSGLPQQQYWIHKGLFNNKTVFENTIPAFDSAYRQHLSGVEMDVFYIDSINDFIITHDLPNRYQLAPLRLSEVFLKYDTAFSYWLDLKNLNDVNKERITLKFKSLMTPSLSAKVFIESANAAALGYLAAQKLNTLYWIQYNRTNFIRKWFKLTLIKWQFIQYRYCGATIAASMTDEPFFETFKEVPKFIFHIYTPELYRTVQKQQNTAVYLMDYLPAQ